MTTYVGAPILICALLGYRRKAWLALAVTFFTLMMLGDHLRSGGCCTWSHPLICSDFRSDFQLTGPGRSVLAAYES